MSQWLRPPRSLLLILALLTAASVSALAWFDWKLLDQERLVEAQRARERLEQTADRIAANLRRSLAEAGARLADAGVERGVEAVRLTLTDGGIVAEPADRLLYYPLPDSSPEPAAAFAVGESIEFQEHEPGRAAEWYGRQPESAGSLLRLGRALRNAGRIEESRAAWRKLAGYSDATVVGAPAELVARHALYEIAPEATQAAALRDALLRGRWRLTRGQFAFYWGEVAKEAPPAEAVALSEATAELWRSRRTNAGTRGQTTLWIDGRPLVALWRGAPERRTAMVIAPGALLGLAAAGETARSAIFDGEGRLVAGERGAAGQSVVRAAAENELPWTLAVAAPPLTRAPGLLPGQRFLLLGTGVMALFLVAGTYFIARAIRREMEVSRMQSDFVSAVSHEFRSPLTSIRQLSELLALGRVPSEERRGLYYETLVRETARLQRLVESLLNFGRMEAGARPYRFEPVDAARLAQSVAAEFETQLAGCGRQIELLGPEHACVIEADPEALTVALRNLVDNALKYSPDEPRVWVEWRAEREQVAISVRDRGVGIPASERKAIFRKFVRGNSAAVANVKGSGVGLAMVRHIVAAHGGHIRVESEPGQGSTFTMLLRGTGAA